MNRLIPIATFASLLLTGTAMAAPSVVASTKPVHSLVSAVMAGVGEPTLIVKGAASPHTYSLRPSDASALENADIVFWTGHGMELFLADALETLSTKAQTVELAELPGIELLPMREGGAFEPHSHGDEDHGHEEHDHAHEHEEGDMHFWLDPENAKLMVANIAQVLSKADPENEATYQANAEVEIEALGALEE
ncbi:zinc ABC transporter substrate-binding protein [Devosia riboflavina]